MKRSLGVTLSAVIVLLGSLLTLGLALLVGVAAEMQPDPRLAQVLRPILLAEAVVMGGVSVLGIATGVDLLRLRRWARVSVMVFAGFLCMTGFVAGATILVVPFPAPARAPANFGHFMLGVRLGLAGFYFLLLALGAGWIYLFTRPGVKAQFGEKAAPGPAPLPTHARVGVATGRPVSITIIGVLILLGTLNAPVVLLLRFPAFIFGRLFTGWGAAAFYLGFSVLHLAIGIGLLKLQPWSRWAAIALYLFGLANAATMALPGRMEALMEAVWSRFPLPLRPPAGFPMGPMWIYMVPGILTLGVILFFLVREGPAFKRSTE